jgi:hypothetical protein
MMIPGGGGVTSEQIGLLRELVRHCQDMKSEEERDLKRYPEDPKHPCSEQYREWRHNGQRRADRWQRKAEAVETAINAVSEEVQIVALTEPAPKRFRRRGETVTESFGL